MRKLFNDCNSGASGTLCDAYRQIIALFQKNYNTYADPNGKFASCRQAWTINDDIGMIQHIYGWVPFNEGCTTQFGANANDLFTTAGSKQEFDRLQMLYIHTLQYVADGSFNPYVKLIHDPKYLDMAAYAFSIDDAIGFQSYRGDGLLITFAGCGSQTAGLHPCKALDRNDRVVVSMGVRINGVPEWAAFGICSNDADSGQFDPLFASVVFYPQQYPCMFTATDLAGKKYQLVVQTPPQPASPGLTVSCSGVTIPLWCNQAQVAQIPPDPQKNYINADTVIGVPTTHDFNGDNKSDILWRNVSNGGVAMWLMNTQLVQNALGVGSLPSDWQIVGQRDFDGDGKADILWRDNNGGVVMWLIDATNLNNPIKASLGVGSLPVDWTVRGTGDFDGDGKGDILWRNANGGVAIWLMNGATIKASLGVGSMTTDWVVAGVGDFNGDGKSDILWYNTISGNMSMWLLNGATILSSPNVGSLPPATGWSIAGTGDFNADGKSDILFHNSNGGVAMLLMFGGTVLKSLGVGNVPSEWAIAETGNFDGIYLNLSDILWYRASDGAVAMWLIDANRAPQDGFIRAALGVGSVPTVWQIQALNAD
jgi:VCBS repeat protein